MYVVPADIPTKLFTIKKNIFVVMEGGSVAMSAGAHTTSFLANLIVLRAQTHSPFSS
jgi:hypothetical protein